MGVRGGGVEGAEAIAKKSGSFWSVVIGSPIGVGGTACSRINGEGSKRNAGDEQAMSGSAPGSVLRGGDVGGELSMRNLRLIDDRGDFVAGKLSEGGEGVGGKGPSGGGKGDLIREGDAGIGYSAVPPLLLP